MHNILYCNINGSDYKNNNVKMNKSIKVIFRACDKTQELISPADYKICDVANYLRNICNKYIILGMQPTTKNSTI